ncbi:hypothetical protein SISNIDRAFT_493451 [Sistotremastrum niveocremeum HHB9708]|uniref:Uncharacterized protein n=1 Tax=Sistotremastrum niveocremeum HHB9708 TaxID=1314777 RepID=A0A164YVQ2_9AGAM|nr:hypothetical protein SISNIDRAFT_493451 [Sistotremastrum niveocremeum HHB9708]
MEDDIADEKRAHYDRPRRHPGDDQVSETPSRPLIVRENPGGQEPHPEIPTLPLALSGGSLLQEVQQSLSLGVEDVVLPTPPSHVPRGSGTSPEGQEEEHNRDGGLRRAASANLNRTSSTSSFQNYSASSFGHTGIGARHSSSAISSHTSSDAHLLPLPQPQPTHTPGPGRKGVLRINPPFKTRRPLWQHQRSSGNIPPPSPMPQSPHSLLPFAPFPNPEKSISCPNASYSPPRLTLEEDHYSFYDSILDDERFRTDSLLDPNIINSELGVGTGAGLQDSVDYSRRLSGPLANVLRRFSMESEESSRAIVPPSLRVGG